MFLVAWGLTGAFLGWFIWTFFLAWRHQGTAIFPDSKPALPPDPVAELILPLLRLLEKKFGFKVLPEVGVPTEDVVKPPPKAPNGFLAIVGFVALVALALATVVLASATDNARLSQCILFLKSYLLGVRVQALIVGILCGIVFKQHHAAFGNFARRLADAVIGSKDNTAWALQSALAIGLIVVSLFAIRPDFLSYLRSFKLGTVEATFADQDLSSLREANLNLREFRAKLFVNQFFKEFKSVNVSPFLSKQAARSQARRLLGNHTESWTHEIDAITELLFDRYVGPVLSAIACLDNIHARRTAIHDPNLSDYVSAWEDFLLKVHHEQSSLKDYQIESFLNALGERSRPFVEHVRRVAPPAERVAELAPDCVSVVRGSKSNGADQRNQAIAKQIHAHFIKALSTLREQVGPDAAKLSLLVFEPYVTAPIAELVSLVSGEKEKADFLQNILRGFPLSEKLATAGIINLYYQVTDSQLNSVGSLPLDLMVEQIQYATRGAKILMRESRKQLEDNKTTVGGVYSRKKLSKRILAETYGRFLQNSFVTQRAEIDVYIQSVLDGQILSNKHRQDWMIATSRVLATLQQHSNLPRLAIDGLPRIDLDNFEAGRTRDTKFDPDFVLQANLSIALSAILLIDGTRPTAQNCNTALFHVNEATLAIEPTVTENELSWALENRLRQWVGAVANRVGESCNWTDARGQSKAEGPNK